MESGLRIDPLDRSDTFLEVADDEESPSVYDTPSPAVRPSNLHRVNLEGCDWLLTTLLITLDAILLALYQAEDTKWATFLTWFYSYRCNNGWVCELLNTLFIMAAAVANVSLMIPVININVRTPERRSWRGWLALAWCGLLLVDAMTILQVQDSVRNFIRGEEDVDSWAAHFWLISMAALLAIGLNARFVYLYGWFSFLTCNGERALKTKQGLVQVYYNESKLREKHIRARQHLHRETQSLLNVVRAPKLQRFNTGKFLEQVADGFTGFVDRRVRFVRSTNLNIVQKRENSLEETSGELQEHMQHLLKESFLRSWAASLAQKVKHAYAEVAQVENVFEYSSWIKSAAIFTVLMLIYNCIKTAEICFNLASSWDDYHRLADRFQDILSSTRANLKDLDRNLTAISATTYEEGTVTPIANDTLPSVTQDVSELQDILAEFDKATGSAYDVAGSILDVALLTSAKLINITDLKNNAVVSTFFYVDSIIPILKYTCIIGYLIGTFVGLNSLYQVLVQHKRMSLALEQALATKTNSLFGKEDLDEDDARYTLLGIDKKYEIGGSVYFFGILMSTALVQQTIFGFIATMVLAVLADIRNFDILLNLGGYLIFVYVAVMISNLILTHVIGDRLLTKEGFHIQHPWLFFFYLFVFSMVHAVLGFLYALWRALLLLATTFWVLNRLDVSLFLTGKQFDNGHYSFMSMLLLTRVIRLTNIAQGYVQAPSPDHPECLSESSTSLMSQENSLSLTISGPWNQDSTILEEVEEEEEEVSPAYDEPPTATTHGTSSTEIEEEPDEKTISSSGGLNEDATIHVQQDKFL